MGSLIYAALCSLDGYVEDSQGDFSWAQPREDLHRFINHLDSKIDMLLFGRKMWEIMTYWDSDLTDVPDYIQDYSHIWKKTPKIVFSRTMKAVTFPRTELRQSFDPEEVRSLKNRTQGNLGIGGAELASVAMAHGLVDELYLFYFPVLVGAGKVFIFEKIKHSLFLKETEVFEGGVVLLHYQVDNNR